MTADRVLYTSPEMERLAREEFPEVLRGKTGVVPHGFVPDWYDLTSLSPSPAGPLRVLHTGHFYGPRTPRPLLRALERLNGDHLEDRLVFSFYGSFPEADRNALRGTPLERAFQIHGTVPYLESLAHMRQHDMLLLVDAPLRDQSESVFLPSKLVDYLGSGKPVMAISPMEGATARVVRQVGGYLCDVGDVDGIRQCLAEVLNGRSLRTPDPSRAAEYHYLNTADRMLEYLKSC
ncbi:MAG TPA: hypothetical protein VFP10_03590, partial [Candidatus Eisenbacteria bacterium]|nr:hypothetical protein [Candidatus Eisenbacteria bacterium]